MSKFKEKMDVSITEYLQTNRDESIKRILSILDIVEMPQYHKKKIRQAVLDEINNLYTASCRVLTYIQED